MSELERIASDHPELADLDPGARRLALRNLVQAGDPDGHTRAVRALSDEIDGYGPLTGFFTEPDVTDVLVNGPDEVWIERDGRLERTSVGFPTASDLYLFIDRLLTRAGERVDMAKPLADARLPDGSRLHVAIPPIAPNGPLLSIRRLWRGWDLPGLVERHMMSREQAGFLETCVDERKTVLIAGGTGTGKTTLLNALLGLVPHDERVVLIEETPELHPACDHFVSLVTRGAGEEGAGAVEMTALLRAALRMRPDRIVVGEVRGSEALVALGAMSTGHPGSLLTVHASSPRGALERLVTLAGEGRPGAIDTSVRPTVDAAIDVVVQLSRHEGTRRVVEIVEP